MSDILNDRKKGFEAKFSIDQETQFKIEARRNKLFGLWLSERLGLPESEQEPYATEVMLSDLKEPGIEDIVSKVLQDIQEKNAKIERPDIIKKLEEFNKIAIREILGD